MKYTSTLKRVFDRGRISFLPPDEEGSRERIREVLRRCKEKYFDYVKVTFEPPYKPRTTGKGSQNHRINGFIMQICEYTGDDFGAMKMYIKKRAIRRGYPVKRNNNGDMLVSRIDGDPIPESEKYINTVEAGYLNDEIEQVAAEAGIILQEE